MEHSTEKHMEDQPGHTYDFKILGRVYASLLFLAALMVGFFLLPIQRLPIDWLDLLLVKRLLILGCSLVMAAIVAGFLMGLKYEKSKLNSVIFFTNFAFLFVFLVFTLADVACRGIIDPSFMQQINWKSPVHIDSTADSTPTPIP